MFSVVLLNYHRPSNIQDKILPILVELEDCAEIIISHGKKETFFESSHAKVICRDDSTIDSIWGVGRRFLAALDCRSDIVVFLDDDVLPIPKNLIELVKYCMAEPERLHGSRDTGRVINNQGYFARVPQDGKARVILTQCVAAHKTKIQNYIEWIQKPENLEILLILQNAKPVFNGEDITFSLASGSEHKFYQNLNMNGLPSPHAICNMSGHQEHRSRIVKTILNPSSNLTHQNNFYWESRYKVAKDSGIGSTGKFNSYKAKFLSEWLSKNSIQSVLDVGVGNGNLLKELQLSSVKYIGLDVSETIVTSLRAMFPNLKFDLLANFFPQSYDVSMSCDVLFHQVNPKDFYSHLDFLFTNSTKYVIIQASNRQEHKVPHVFHRPFVNVVLLKYNCQLIFTEKNPSNPDSLAQFYIFSKNN